MWTIVAVVVGVVGGIVGGAYLTYLAFIEWIKEILKSG